MKSMQIVRVEKTAVAEQMAALKNRAVAYAMEAKSEATRKAYDSDWRVFENWCCDIGAQALPSSPETVALFITWAASQKQRPATIDRRLVAVSQAHKIRGLPSPTFHALVRQILKGIRRQLGTAQNQKAPIAIHQLEQMVQMVPDSLVGARNRALLLIGFAGGFRRSELVALDISNLTFVEEGVVIQLRKSKTDQFGQGRQIGIPYAVRTEMCPVGALRSWLETAGIDRGPVFRQLNRHGQVLPSRLSGSTVSRTVKQCIEAAGYDPTIFAGHSLRSGFATAAASNGKNERDIMRTTGHRNVRTLRRYIRECDVFKDNASQDLL